MEEALEKLKEILNLLSLSDSEKLSAELSEMMPANKNARVTTKIGWGYSDNLLQVGFDFMTVPYKKVHKKDAFYLYSELMKQSEQLPEEFIEAFDIIINKKLEKIKLGFIPALEIAKQTKACSINFNIS